ncbi:ABC transporter permease [Christensenella tenuis]|uniref:ABC transporter permease n=1 Tax=Christensenella tenuis TaxID=2763033 RepID=A0ABR7EDZ1_9FIRM|nr:ABC transporter permease [Christensenella tenuis]MBC5648003.1 ABC transporter permease [Christensenella tenuis]
MKSKISNTARTFHWRQNVVYIAFVVVVVVFSILLTDSGFLKISNILNIVRQTSIISIIAIAMTFVICAGELDLSVGALVGLTSLTCAMALSSGYGILGALGAGLGTGALFGLANGLLVSRLSIPSFIVTIGTSSVANGVAMWITGSAPVPIDHEAYLFAFGTGDIGGAVPVLLVWLVVAAVIGNFVLKRTRYGRRVLATGANPVAARFTGINVKNIKLSVMLLMGVVTGLGGMLYAGRMYTGRYTLGDGAELDAIAAVILGGAALSGGKGSIIGTIVGAFLIGMVNNGLIIMGLNVSQQLIIRGLIVILAVAFGYKNSKQ